MIHVFPMLTSSSISPTVVPGISKALEMYILIYQLNKLKVGGSIAFENDQIIIDEQPVAKSSSKEKTTDISLKPKWKPGKVEFDKVDEKSLSLQPTWIKVTVGGKAKVLGVKVISVPLKSDSDILSLLLHDKNLSGLKYGFVKTERNIARVAYKVWGATLGRLFKTPLTGKPKEDIILRTTEFKDRVFTLMNVLDIDEEFLREIKDVRKLHKLGWNSLVFADDVNRRASFCMKEFKGLCTTVPYSYLFATVSTTASKVFEDLTDVRKSAGPIFRKKMDPSKLISEAIIRNKRKKYDLINESEMLQEFSTEKIKGVLTNLYNGLKSKDINKVKTALKSGSKPRMSLDQVKIKAKKSVKGFDKSYNMSSKVLENSVKLPKEINDSVAIMISIGAAAKGGNIDKNTKDYVKKVISRFRDAKIGKNETIRKETIISIIFIVMTVIVGGASLALILSFLTPITTVFTILFLAAVEVLIFYGLLKL